MSMASQDTVHLEELPPQVAVVDSRSILKVVSSSQSFREERLLLQTSIDLTDQAKLGT